MGSGLGGPFQKVGAGFVPGRAFFDEQGHAVAAVDPGIFAVIFAIMLDEMSAVRAEFFLHW